MLTHHRQAQQLGLSLKEIAPLLDLVDGKEFSEDDTVLFLEERLAIVQQEMAELKEIEGFIQQKLNTYRR